MAGTSQASDAGSSDTFLESDLYLTPGVKIFEREAYRIIAHPQCSSPYMIRDLDAQARLAMEEAPELLGIPWDAKRYGDRILQIFVTNDNIRSHAAAPHVSEPKPNIYLPCHVVRDLKAPVLHEFAHLMVPWLGNMSLREGLADWVQFTLRPGKPAAFVPKFDDPHAMAVELAGRYPHLLTKIGRSGVPQFRTEEERFAFYHLSRSYVYFAVSKQGLGDVLKAIQDAQTQPADKQKPQRFHSDWLSHLDSLAAK